MLARTRKYCIYMSGVRGRVRSYLLLLYIFRARGEVESKLKLINYNPLLARRWGGQLHQGGDAAGQAHGLREAAPRGDAGWSGRRGVPPLLTAQPRTGERTRWGHAQWSVLNCCYYWSGSVESVSFPCIRIRIKARFGYRSVKKFFGSWIRIRINMIRIRHTDYYYCTGILMQRCWSPWRVCGVVALLAVAATLPTSPGQTWPTLPYPVTTSRGKNECRRLKMRWLVVQQTKPHNSCSSGFKSG